MGLLGFYVTCSKASRVGERISLHNAGQEEVRLGSKLDEGRTKEEFEDIYGSDAAARWDAAAAAGENSPSGRGTKELRAYNTFDVDDLFLRGNAAHSGQQGFAADN